MKIAVCDDEHQELEGICSFLNRYDVSHTIDTKQYTSGAELLKQIESGIYFDLLLLDIEMDVNGFELARKIAAKPKKPLIVFITRLNEYAAQGYGIAFRYLVKPVEYSAFSKVMDAAVRQLRNDCLWIKDEGNMRRIEASEILYVESSGHNLTIHQEKNRVCLRMTMQNVSDQLCEAGFFAPHKGYLVNIKHIQKITETEVILTNNTHIPLSRRNKTKLEQVFYRSLEL